MGRVRCTALREPEEPAGAASRALRGSPHLDGGGQWAHRLGCRPCGGFATSLSQQPMYRRSAWALLVPLLLAGNAALFVVSAIPPLGIGASVDVELRLAGDEYAYIYIYVCVCVCV